MNITFSHPLCRTHTNYFQPVSHSSEMLQMMRLMEMLNHSMAAQGGCLPARPSFGGTAPYFQSGSPMGEFLGLPMSGRMATGDGPQQAMGSGTNSAVGSALLQSINRNPVPPGCRPGYCYRGVKHHLRQIGVNLTGGSAYQAADQLANSDRFREVQVSREQLRSLPAGAVVVWNRGNGRRHGHISIAMGDGREASDRIRRQITNYPNSFRVFIPN